MSNTASELPHISLRAPQEQVTLTGSVLEAAGRVRERLGSTATLADVVSRAIAVLDLARDAQLLLRDGRGDVQDIQIWGP